MGSSRVCCITHLLLIIHFALSLLPLTVTFGVWYFLYGKSSNEVTIQEHSYDYYYQDDKEWEKSGMLESESLPSSRETTSTFNEERAQIIDGTPAEISVVNLTHDFAPKDEVESNIPTAEGPIVPIEEGKSLAATPSEEDLHYKLGEYRIPRLDNNQVDITKFLDDILPKVRNQKFQFGHLVAELSQRNHKNSLIVHLKRSHQRQPITNRTLFKQRVLSCKRSTSATHGEYANALLRASALATKVPLRLERKPLVNLLDFLKRTHELSFLPAQRFLSWHSTLKLPHPTLDEDTQEYAARIVENFRQSRPRRRSPRSAKRSPKLLTDPIKPSVDQYLGTTSDSALPVTEIIILSGTKLYPILGTGCEYSMMSADFAAKLQLEIHSDPDRPTTTFSTVVEDRTIPPPIGFPSLQVSE